MSENGLYNEIDLFNIIYTIDSIQENQTSHYIKNPSTSLYIPLNPCTNDESGHHQLDNMSNIDLDKISNFNILDNIISSASDRDNNFDHLDNVYMSDVIMINQVNELPNVQVSFISSTDNSTNNLQTSVKAPKKISVYTLGV